MSEEIFSPKSMRIAIVSCTDGENSQYDLFNKNFHSRRRYSTKSDTEFHKDFLSAALKFNEHYTRSSNESPGVICRRQKECDAPQDNRNEIITTVEPSEMEQLRSHLMKTDLRRSFTSSGYSRSNSLNMVSRSNSFTGNVA